jgi:hypothetical protein
MTVKKMQWNRNRPPGLILDVFDDDDVKRDLPCFVYNVLPKCKALHRNDV